MKGLGSKLRIVSKSKCIRFGVVLLIVLFLLVSLEDKFNRIGNSEGQKVPHKKRAIRTGIFQNRSDHHHETKLTPVKAFIPDSIRILCYILQSRSRVKTAKIIKETWGSHCDDIVFFGGYEYPELPVTFLNISEGYENLWGKSKAAILYLAKSSKYKNIQYFLKADDDTFVIVENLRKFIKSSIVELNKPVWFGYKLKHKRMSQGYMSGGAGYVFNYEALSRVSTLLRKGHTSRDSHPPDILNKIGNCNADADYGVEDLELGKCFLNAGVDNINTIDANGGERFLPISYDVLLNGAVSSFHWIWSQAWNRIKTGESCCSQDLISMHEVSPTQMKTMYYLLYKIRIANKSIE